MCGDSEVKSDVGDIFTFFDKEIFHNLCIKKSTLMVDLFTYD